MEKFKMNATRAYFIRTRNRNRILATLVCRIVGRPAAGDQTLNVPHLAFGISRASAEESSPSRKIGRLIATERLEQAVTDNKNVFTVSYRRDIKDTPDLMIAGILELSQVVPTLNRLLLCDSWRIPQTIPNWCWRQDPNCFDSDHVDQYLDMFCKIRNSVEKGAF